MKAKLLSVGGTLFWQFRFSRTMGARRYMTCPKR